MDLQKMGKFIAEMRKKRGLTQSELGEELGLSGKAISKWERGISAPDISILNELSIVLDVSISEILIGEKINENITTETAKEINEITISSIDTYNKYSKKKYSKIIFILISIILLIILLFSTTYFITNYNKCFVYKLSSASDDFYLEGLIASNQKENSVIITGIIYNDKNIGSNQELTANKFSILFKINKFELYKRDYYYENESIDSILKHTNIVLNESEKLKYTKDILNGNNYSNMTINIIYSNDKGVENELIIPVKIEKKFSNNRLFY